MSEAFKGWWQSAVTSAPRNIPQKELYRVCWFDAQKACEKHYSQEIEALKQEIVALRLNNAGQAGRMWSIRYELELLEGHLTYIENANTELSEVEQMLQEAQERIRKVRSLRTLYDVDRGR